MAILKQTEWFALRRERTHPPLRLSEDAGESISAKQTRACSRARAALAGHRPTQCGGFAVRRGVQLAGQQTHGVVHLALPEFPPLLSHFII